MQCGLVQCSARAGDFAGNLAHLGEILEQAPEAELYCLPPNALCGVTVASLGLWQAYARAQEQALSLLAARHSAKTLLVPYLQAFNHNDMLGCVLLAHGCRKKISLNSLTVQGNFAFGSFCLGSHRVGHHKSVFTNDQDRIRFPDIKKICIHRFCLRTAEYRSQ